MGGWASDDTGMSSSNCIMNDFAIAVHYEKYQYHSYEAEICLQVRKGTMDKDEAFERLTDIKPSKQFKDIKKNLKHLKLMCGIVGIYNSFGLSENLKNIKTFHRMVNSLNHRGLDDNGIIICNNAILGHTRLSIVDLENGSQPMCSEDKKRY